jgi:hypothetical protein
MSIEAHRGATGYGGQGERNPLILDQLLNLR